ncbi:MAG: peptide ABC transporter substrate-binding protein [Chloroflexi bacterium]|nr:peptide ABC transporter substrate-binding protein [Chloroflexota bacterium]
MNRKYAFVLVAMLALLVGMVAPAAAQGSAITVMWPQEPDAINPMYTTMTFGGYTYQLFLAAVWEFDENYNPYPVLVSEMPSPENGGISEDGRTFTYKLKEGMLWSDGDPLDSADVLFTLDMWANERNTTQGRSPYDLIESAEAPDATTVVITFSEPYAPWLGFNFRPLPEHILRPIFEAEGTLDNAEFNKNPTVASGPYVLAEYVVGTFMRFVANPNFVLGAPKIETVVVTFVPDEQAYTASMLAGDADLGTFFPASEVQTLRDAGIDVRIIGSGYNEGLFFNAGDRAHPAMADIRVRKALALGFDRFSISEDLNYGVLPPGASYWENTPYANPNLEPVPYDPEQAKALLDEAGWVDSDGDGIRDKDGVKLEVRFIATTRGIRRDMQALAQQWYQELGISMLIENYESGVFFGGYDEGGPAATGQYEIATWSSAPGGFPDPDTVRFECDYIPSDDNPAGDNWNYFCDEELDALLKQQRTETDAEARIALFHQIDEKIYNSYIWVSTWFDADLWAVSPRLTNVRLNGTTPFFDIVNWELAG